MTEVRQQRSAVRNQRDNLATWIRMLSLRPLCLRGRIPIFDLRLLTSVLCVLLFALCAPADAQRQVKIAKIGWLAVPACVRGFRDRVVPARIQ